MSKAAILDSPLKPFGVTGENLRIEGQQVVFFTLGGHRYEHTFVVCPLPTDIAGILGADFLESAKAQISFEAGETKFSTTREVSPKHGTKRAVLTVFPEKSRSGDPQTAPQAAQESKRKTTESPRLVNTPDECRAWLVKTTVNVTLAPRCRQIALGHLEMGKGEATPH
jgi:hypothetical protein